MNSKSMQVVWVGDLHVGSTVGLSPLTYEIDDGNIHKASESQELLLGFWNGFIERRKRDKRPFILIIGGDVVDGDHHNTFQIWTKDELVQVDAAVQLLKPLVNLARKSFLLKGTTAHVGESGRYDSRVARELGIPAYYQLRLSIGGVLFDLAHHGVNVGKRAWNIGNVARSYARSIAMTNILQHRPAPDAIVRGHIHRHCHETVRDYGHVTEMIIAPAWQIKTEFAFRVATEDDLSDVGGIVIGVENGRVVDVDFDMMQFEQAQFIKV